MNGASTLKKKTSYQHGLWAESMAAFYLRLKGYRILKWRYKTPIGEIDLIAQKGTALVFVEVKLRPRLDQGLEAVQEKSQRRIEAAARHYMAQSRSPVLDMRFDVIAISWPYFIRHLDNAWRPDT